MLTEADAIATVNRGHDLLPWLHKPEIDAMRDDLPDWWADQLIASRAR
jgi:hypothetical protein